MVAKYTHSMTIGNLKEFLVLNLMFGQFLQQVVIHLLRCLAFLQMGNGNGDLLDPWTKNICIKIVSQYSFMGKKLWFGLLLPMACKTAWEGIRYRSAEVDFDKLVWDAAIIPWG